MTNFAIDDALLVLIVAGFVIGTVHLISQAVALRTNRLAEVKAIANLRKLYHRSFRRQGKKQ